MAGAAWRASAEWIAAVGDFEALNCLATFAYERPEAVFPELAADSDGPLFEGDGVQHPLLDPRRGRCQRRDLSAQACSLWVVSGSNMSGKSTLLRAVGLNAVLAWAGRRCVARSCECRRCAWARQFA